MRRPTPKNDEPPLDAATSPTPPRDLARRLADLVREATGNVLADDRTPFLAEVAERRAAATHLPSADEYLERLASGELPNEWAVLTSLLTVKESYFHRGPQQLEALGREVLPRLIAARAKERRLWIWSAACARGEEPSSLAILLAERPELVDWNWRILATDLDAEALAAAKRGIYGERALARVTPEERKRWFAPSGKLWQLAPELSARIDYQPLNLARLPYRLPVSSFDLIFLRNVLIYFRRTLQRRVADQVARFLAPEGYLFLGGSETLWQVRSTLEPVDLSGCFAYRHPGAGEAAATATPPRATPPAAPRPALSKAASLATTAARVAPAREPAPTKRGGDRPAAVMSSAPLASPTSHAREPLLDPPRGSGGDPLADAARALERGELDSAERAAAAAVAADPSEPAAHAVAAFVFDLAGRTDEALAAYRAALYLDPSLFQPRLLLADCLLRLGHSERAAREYREILAALEAGKAKALSARAPSLAAVAFPDRERATRRCRQALAGMR